MSCIVAKPDAVGERRGCEDEVGEGIESGGRGEDAKDKAGAVVGERDKDGEEVDLGERGGRFSEKSLRGWAFGA